MILWEEARAVLGARAPGPHPGAACSLCDCRKVAFPPRGRITWRCRNSPLRLWTGEKRLGGGCPVFRLVDHRRSSGEAGVLWEVDESYPWGTAGRVGPT